MNNKANFRGFKIHGYEQTPEHYKSVYDVVDFLTDLPPLPFLFGDTIKRIVRLDRKGQKALDLKKIEYNLIRMQGCGRSLEMITTLYNPIVIERYNIEANFKDFVKENRLGTMQESLIYLLMTGMAGINVTEFIETLKNN